ncbi:MAG TPA: glycogen synthase, partial [Holophagaceae bacterium]|nr:glycogen synthase [Holophagaceae bacterium]
GLEILPLPMEEGARLLFGRAPSGLPVYLLDAPWLFGRDTNPYAEDGGSPRRYAALAVAASRLAEEGDGAGWKPDVVHAHDWPAGLVPAYVAGLGPSRPATVMTVHNAAYQGLFPGKAFAELGLPEASFSPQGVEFHGKVSLLKAGLQYADKLTTVSPTFARELQAPAGGKGLEGLFAHRAADLSGILNGVDTSVWDPAFDPFLPMLYDDGTVDRRTFNKITLQAELGLEEDLGAPLFGVVSRLDPLKGLDLVLENEELLAELGAQLVVLGRGSGILEDGFRELAEARPRQVALVPDQNEGLAHRIFGGADFILVPSRYEPCGLTQMYAQRYGALPIVRRTGGLADTVEDLEIGGPEATGFVFEEATAEALAGAIFRANAWFREAPDALKLVQRRAMVRDFSWAGPAQQYQDLYASLAPT